jgi:hypothetical protein
MSKPKVSRNQTQQRDAPTPDVSAERFCIRLYVGSDGSTIDASVIAIVAMPVSVATPTVTPGRGDCADDRASCRPDCRASERRASKASRRQSADARATESADDRAACGALSGSVTARERQRSDERDYENRNLPRQLSIRESNHCNNLPLSASRRLMALPASLLVSAQAKLRIELRRLRGVAR